MYGKVWVAVVAMSVTIAACSGSEPEVAPTSVATTTVGSTATTAASATTTTPPTTSVPTTTTTAPTTTSTTMAEDELPEGVERTDYLTFAQGANPVGFTIEGPGEGLKNSLIMQVIDGNSVPRGLIGGATAETIIEIVFELPAPTTFDRLAIPEVLEVPSAFTTFFQTLEVSGSASPGGPFEILATGVLETHERTGEVTELEILAEIPVTHVKLRLGGGIEILEDATWFEFSEIIGNGTQEEVALIDGFTGIWDAKLPDIDRSIGLIELSQNGAIVIGCLNNIDLSGTVTGNIARLTGVDRNSGIMSAYIFSFDASGGLQGVASVNGGPFAFTPSVVAPEGSTTSCTDVPEPEHPLTCGAVVYGINFGFNSATLRPDSEPVLQELFEGLQADASALIVVEGHTSTEGSADYNQSLSERRAQSVVDDLVGRGIDSARISARGVGETEPLISPDDDESSRSINRRVEIDCG